MNRDAALTAAPGTAHRHAARRSADRGLPLAAAGMLLGLGVIAGAVAWQVREGQRLPDGPVPVAWDREVCAHCHMQVSEMAFAVQLQTSDGEVVNFDDPGCFFLYLDGERPAVHEVWFHDSRGDRWLRRSEVGFVPAAATPMNLGFAAVARDVPGALTFDEARARVAARPEVRSDA
jgi:hypothetical protein